MGHSTTYKTCGITQLLLALLHFFFALNASAPIRVKVLAGILIVTAFMSTAVIIGGDDAKMSMIKILCHMCMMFGTFSIVVLFMPPDFGNPAIFNVIRHSVIFIFGMCLSVFLVYMSAALQVLRIRNTFPLVLSIIAALLFFILYCVYYAYAWRPAWPLHFIGIPFAINGIA
jgi:hypothetical protein